MSAELFFYKECGFSQKVLNLITNLGIGDNITYKNIRENPDFEKELVALCGDKQVPTLKLDDEVVRESDAICQLLVKKFAA